MSGTRHGCPTGKLAVDRAGSFLAATEPATMQTKDNLSLGDRALLKIPTHPIKKSTVLVEDEISNSNEFVIGNSQHAELATAVSAPDQAELAAATALAATALAATALAQAELAAATATATAMHATAMPARTRREVQDRLRAQSQAVAPDSALATFVNTLEKLTADNLPADKAPVFRAMMDEVRRTEEAVRQVHRNHPYAACYRREMKGIFARELKQADTDMFAARDALMSTVQQWVDDMSDDERRVALESQLKNCVPRHCKETPAQVHTIIDGMLRDPLFVQGMTGLPPPTSQQRRDPVYMEQLQETIRGTSDWLLAEMQGMRLGGQFDKEGVYVTPGKATFVDRRMEEHDRQHHARWSLVYPDVPVRNAPLFAFRTGESLLRQKVQLQQLCVRVRHEADAWLRMPLWNLDEAMRHDLQTAQLRRSSHAAMPTGVFGLERTRVGRLMTRILSAAGVAGAAVGGWAWSHGPAFVQTVGIDISVAVLGSAVQTALMQSDMLRTRLVDMRPDYVPMRRWLATPLAAQRLTWEWMMESGVAAASVAQLTADSLLVALDPSEYNGVTAGANLLVVMGAGLYRHESTSLDQWVDWQRWMPSTLTQWATPFTADASLVQRATRVLHGEAEMIGCVNGMVSGLLADSEADYGNEDTKRQYENGRIVEYIVGRTVCVHAYEGDLRGCLGGDWTPAALEQAREYAASQQLWVTPPSRYNGTASLRALMDLPLVQEWTRVSDEAAKQTRALERLYRRDTLFPDAAVRKVEHFGFAQKLARLDAALSRVPDKRTILQLFSPSRSDRDRERIRDKIVNSIVELEHAYRTHRNVGEDELDERFRTILQELDKEEASSSNLRDLAPGPLQTTADAVSSIVSGNSKTNSFLRSRIRDTVQRELFRKEIETIREMAFGRADIHKDITVEMVRAYKDFVESGKTKADQPAFYDPSASSGVLGVLHVDGTRRDGCWKRQSTDATDDDQWHLTEEGMEAFVAAYRKNLPARNAALEMFLYLAYRTVPTFRVKVGETMARMHRLRTQQHPSHNRDYVEDPQLFRNDPSSDDVISEGGGAAESQWDHDSAFRNQLSPDAQRLGEWVVECQVRDSINAELGNEAWSWRSQLLSLAAVLITREWARRKVMQMARWLVQVMVTLYHQAGRVLPERFAFVAFILTGMHRLLHGSHGNRVPAPLVSVIRLVAAVGRFLPMFVGSCMSTRLMWRLFTHTASTRVWSVDNFMFTVAQNYPLATVGRLMFKSICSTQITHHHTVTQYNAYQGMHAPVIRPLQTTNTSTWMFFMATRAHQFFFTHNFELHAQHLATGGKLGDAHVPANGKRESQMSPDERRAWEEQKRVNRSETHAAMLANMPNSATATVSDALLGAATFTSMTTPLWMELVGSAVVRFSGGRALWQTCKALRHDLPLILWAMYKYPVTPKTAILGTDELLPSILEKQGADNSVAKLPVPANLQCSPESVRRHLTYVDAFADRWKARYPFSLLEFKTRVLGKTNPFVREAMVYISLWLEAQVLAHPGMLCALTPDVQTAVEWMFPSESIESDPLFLTAQSCADFVYMRLTDMNMARVSRDNRSDLGVELAGPLVSRQWRASKSALIRSAFGINLDQLDIEQSTHASLQKIKEDAVRFMSHASQGDRATQLIADTFVHMQDDYGKYLQAENTGAGATTAVVSASSSSSSSSSSALSVRSVMDWTVLRCGQNVTIQLFMLLLESVADIGYKSAILLLRRLMMTTPNTPEGREKISTLILQYTKITGQATLARATGIVAASPLGLGRVATAENAQWFVKGLLPFAEKWIGREAAMLYFFYQFASGDDKAAANRASVQRLNESIAEAERFLMESAGEAMMASVDMVQGRLMSASGYLGGLLRAAEHRRTPLQHDETIALLEAFDAETRMMRVDPVRLPALEAASYELDALDVPSRSTRARRSRPARHDIGNDLADLSRGNEQTDESFLHMPPSVADRPRRRRQ